eukprot:gene2865-5629_t
MQSIEIFLSLDLGKKCKNKVCEKDLTPNEKKIEGYLDTIRYLLVDPEYVKIKDTNEFTALMIACMEKSTDKVDREARREIVKMMLEKLVTCVDLDAINQDGKTALELTTDPGIKKMIEIRRRELEILQEPPQITQQIKKSKIRPKRKSKQNKESQTEMQKDHTTSSNNE